uniref:DENN domain-containing protein 5A n=1 Tax=Aceria tosichella TaxID=561515 RepID=A0A6G1S6Q4_9ACAR
MAKLVKLFLIFGPVHGSIKVIKKYANPGQTIDESLMSTLCLPHIELVHEPTPEPRFLTFLVTKEDGQVLYGSGLIVFDRYNEPPPYPGAGRYASFCYTIITDIPFIHATKLLLQLIWNKKCDDIIIRAMMNINLPARRKCLRIVTPLINSTETHKSHAKAIDEIYLYRGMTDLPLLDYPIRELFGFLNIDDFLLAYACLLMEFRTLIISQDNYKLMMVGETLTSLLLPLKWCNVYVPILPPVYGATYLDAPTSYIMGINTQVTELPDSLNHVQCRIYCDESRVVCDADSLALPLFLNDIKKDIIRIMADSHALHERTTTYLDDLKFNRAIRMLFIKTIRRHILANYERYIVDVPEQSEGVRQFDVVSYLSDQPEFMRSFLSKFLETQLFASFVDENAERIKQSWLSIFDMEPEELSEHFSDKALEDAFQNAQRIHLMDLRQEHPDIEVKTVPASPMKLRRRMPALSAISNRLSFATKSSKSKSIDYQNSIVNSIPPLNDTSPPLHRNSVATVSLQGNLSLNPSSPSISSINRPNFSGNSPSSLKTNAISSPPVPNGRIIELIEQVKNLTKRILIEKIGDQVPDNPDSLRKRGKFGCNSPLIGALCDIIERVWAHGAFTSHQDSSSCCPLWRHLLAFTRLKYLDSRTTKHEFTDGSHLDVLSTRPGETTELDMMFVGDQQTQQTSRFSSKFNNWFKTNIKFDSLTRDLIDDFKTILMLKDVKTDVGKARAFIKLSLEGKKLSKHLKTLIGDQELLNSLYKPYAFLRCEDEREQFLMYLLTLNAVDLPCFTSTFVNVINTRRMNTNKGTV